MNANQQLVPTSAVVGVTFQTHLLTHLETIENVHWRFSSCLHLPCKGSYHQSILSLSPMQRELLTVDLVFVIHVDPKWATTSWSCVCLPRKESYRQLILSLSPKGSCHKLILSLSPKESCHQLILPCLLRGAVTRSFQPNLEYLAN